MLCALLLVGYSSTLNLVPNNFVLVLGNEGRGLSLYPMFRPKSNMNIYFHIDHIAICICNGSNCWFKHPLPST